MRTQVNWGCTGAMLFVLLFWTAMLWLVLGVIAS